MYLCLGMLVTSLLSTKSQCIIGFIYECQHDRKTWTKILKTEWNVNNWTTIHGKAASHKNIQHISQRGWWYTPYISIHQPTFPDQRVIIHHRNPCSKNSGTLFLIQMGLSTSHFYTAHIFQTKYWITEKSLFLLSYIITSLGFLPLLGAPFLWSVRLIKHIMKIKSLKDREKAQYEPKALWLWALQIFSCCISNLSIWTDDIINIK